MNVKLVDGENIIKEYIYRKDLVDENEIGNNTLCITNKRVIICSKHNDEVIRDELPVKDIERVETYYNHGQTPAGKKKVFFLILGIICFLIGIGSIVLGKKISIGPVNISLYLVFLGIFFTVIGIIRLIHRKKPTDMVKFEFILYTKYPYVEALEDSFSTFQAVSVDNKKKKKNNKKEPTVTYTFQVPMDVVENMAEELGSVILQAKLH